MSSLNIPNNLRRSFVDFSSYPENLVIKSPTAYRSKLTTYKNILEDRSHTLFIKNEALVDLPYREFSKGGDEEPRKGNNYYPSEFLQWLGFTFDTKDARITLMDPKCRFIYIYGKSSRSELQLTKDMLLKVLSYHQVMPTYLDFIFTFGAQIEAGDLKFSGFYEQTLLGEHSGGIAAHELGRSGRQFQLCYNLAGVSDTKYDRPDIKLGQWSIRRAAIHHQFDVVYGTTLWIVTKGRDDIKSAYKELTGKTGRQQDKAYQTVEQCLRSSFAAHLLFCYWATHDWRWYITWIETDFDHKTKIAKIGSRVPGSASKEYAPNDIQKLQIWLEKVDEAVMILETNVKTVSSLQKYYRVFENLKDLPEELLKSCHNDIMVFLFKLDEVINDLQSNIARAKLLSGSIMGRKELIQQHIHGQASHRMMQLNVNMERDAGITQIITVVALIYLPATFVSTLFSTDIIKYQDPNGGEPNTGKFSHVALIRWLEVTIPLTAITLFGAWTMYKTASFSRESKSELKPISWKHSLKWISKPKQTLPVAESSSYEQPAMKPTTSWKIGP